MNEPDVTNEVVIQVSPNDTLVMTSYDPANKVTIKKPQQRKGKKDKEDEAMPKVRRFSKIHTHSQHVGLTYAASHIFFPMCFYVVVKNCP